MLRICQEALTNIKKHSGAHNVRITVKPSEHHIKVIIADDGCGFDSASFFHDGAHSRGQGLAVMRERAQSVGGEFRVLSQPGRGTEVHVEVPISVRGSVS